MCSKMHISCPLCAMLLLLLLHVMGLLSLGGCLAEPFVSQGQWECSVTDEGPR